VRADLYRLGRGNRARGRSAPGISGAKLSQRLALIGAFGLAHQAPAFVVPLPGFQPAGCAAESKRRFRKARASISTSAPAPPSPPACSKMRSST
jgi:hypothetical protein